MQLKKVFFFWTRFTHCVHSGSWSSSSPLWSSWPWSTTDTWRRNKYNSQNNRIFVKKKKTTKNLFWFKKPQTFSHLENNTHHEWKTRRYFVSYFTQFLMNTNLQTALCIFTGLHWECESTLRTTDSSTSSRIFEFSFKALSCCGKTPQNKTE